MARYTARRLLQAVPLLLLISALSFVISLATPGGPLSALELDPRITRADRENLERQYGLRDPIPVQYANWMTHLLRGDLGTSIVTHEKVTDIIIQRLPATLLLTTAAALLGIAIGVPLGTFAALRRATWFDNLARVLSVAGSAVPHYWLGFVLIVLLAGGLHWFPAQGMYTLNRDGFDPVDRLAHLALPAIALATGYWAVYTRYIRSEVLEVLSLDYIRTARAKGLGERTVLFGHALRNALIPLITLFGALLPALFAGAALTENVFSWPGLGQKTIAAVFARDYPVVLGVTLFLAALTIFGNLLADLAYGWVDPRVRYQ